MIGYHKVSSNDFGVASYHYMCEDCDYELVTIAAVDLLPDNRAALEEHRTTHVPFEYDYNPNTDVLLDKAGSKL